MSLLGTLHSHPGTYVGPGDGVESGPFAALIEVSALASGAVALDYTAISRTEGRLHTEHSVLAPLPDGRLRLVVSHVEAPFLTELTETATGSGRFEQDHPGGPFTMAIVATAPSPGRLEYAWWWAVAGDEPVEQSRATVALPSSLD
jgi:hypothetical protein